MLNLLTILTLLAPVVLAGLLRLSLGRLLPERPAALRHEHQPVAQELRPAAVEPIRARQVA